MIMSVRFCLLFDLSNAIFSMKTCIVVTDLLMTLLFPAKNVM